MCSLVYGAALERTDPRFATRRGQKLKKQNMQLNIGEYSDLAVIDQQVKIPTVCKDILKRV